MTDLHSDLKTLTKFKTMVSNMLYDAEAIKQFNESMTEAIETVEYFIERDEEHEISKNEYEQERHGWEQV